MKYKVAIDSDALDDLERLRAYDRSAVLNLIQQLLTSAPTRVSKTRIKRLRGFDSPQFRLRVGDFRVLYDVIGDEVLVLRVLAKAALAEYLREMSHETENGDRGATGA